MFRHFHSQKFISQFVQNIQKGCALAHSCGEFFTLQESNFLLKKEACKSITFYRPLLAFLNRFPVLILIIF